MSREQIPHFDDLHLSTPDVGQIEQTIGALSAQLAASDDLEGTDALVRRWDDEVRSVESWRYLVEARFHQNTNDERLKAEKKTLDEIWPQIVGFHTRVKRALLQHRLRPELEARFGKTAFDLWDLDSRSYADEIQSDLARESELVSEYVQLTGSARFVFRGEDHNLSSIVRYQTDPDRGTRRGAETARWQWFADNSETIDRIFDDLVQVRNRMALTLGLRSFIELGYLRMQRVDFTQRDVERLRSQVVNQLVPLCSQIRRDQAARLGLEAIAYWDEQVLDAAPAPRPQGPPEWICDRASEGFDELLPELGALFGLMRERGYLDLVARDGKAPGGFCISVPSVGMPFIFSNFNGTAQDIVVLVHEMGHAFQYFQSRDLPLYDYLWPTMESAEITSHGLEYLTLPLATRLFGSGAERYQRQHVTQNLLFIPYGVAVDEFQHLVYANPAATPAERHQMWREVERRYLPSRAFGELAHPAAGRFWHMQRHIFAVPFYYIDYVLALTAAKQIWARSLDDSRDAVGRYLAVARQGGRLPFQQLLRSAGLQSPFEGDCLQMIVDATRRTLNLDPI
ncbi:MAG: M3 family oligoendopeptidase [Myxococcales bacterium]|nr:M3 family oligoendopeptidase [Myxococcales bacterium]